MFIGKEILPWVALPLGFATNSFMRWKSSSTVVMQVVLLSWIKKHDWMMVRFVIVMIVEGLTTYLVLHIQLTFEVMTLTHYPHLKVIKPVIERACIV
jgi:hypothetical protein